MFGSFSRAYGRFEQPQFTRVKEPTLLCNQIPEYFRLLRQIPATRLRGSRRLGELTLSRYARNLRPNGSDSRESAIAQGIVQQGQSRLLQGPEGLFDCPQSPLRAYRCVP